jgi:leucyl-tRNA synthetase
MDFKKIEGKWQEKWEKNRLFESNPDSRDKFYLTVAYPYPSGGMHVGHMRTYTVPDVIARFRRMQGLNVLFPMAWHVTGTPIIGSLKRLRAKEKEQLRVMKDVYGMTEDELEAINEPMDYANYFIENHYRKGMKSLGYSVDWRRQFTTNDEHYNKFIEWQYLTLKKAGLVKKGLHPVKWCVQDQNPVTTHDILEGESADVNDFVIVKFKLPGRKLLPMATLRPETVFGVTNIWLNPKSTLVEARVDKETWIISKEAAEKLALQNMKVEVKREFKAAELIGKKVKNPVLNNQVTIFPADFVDPDNATGIVMSVPSHAPFDYIALKDLRKDRKEIRKWKLSWRAIDKIKPINLIDTKDLPESPGVVLVEEAGVKNQKDSRKLEELTKQVYKKEFHAGVLNRNCGRYRGKKVSRIKPILVRAYSKKGVFSRMYEFSEPVTCRCGGKVLVAKKNSWFLDYGNRAWKSKVKALLKSMNIIPEHVRGEFESTVEWLEDWPCIRNFGLGTKLPWDKNFIIEPLSDSTIYMAFYTIAHIINKHDPDKITPEVFDFIFLGKGLSEKISNNTGMPHEDIVDARKSFEYWYPLDWRLSAQELVQNHLTFFIFHHAAIFAKNRLPKGIATWGMGLLEGGKMSSSKGNVVLAYDAVEKYGADSVRFFLMTSVEPWQDFDWRASEVETAKKRLLNFCKRIESLQKEATGKGKGLADRWLLSRMNRIIKETTQALEGFQIRKAGLACFFEMDEILRWYLRRREKPDKSTVNTFLETWIRLMAPFTPHLCEELWSGVGKGGFVSGADWPRHTDRLIDERLNRMEELVSQTVDDINEVLKLVGKKPKEINIYVAPRWKHTVYSEILDIEGRDPSKVIAHVMKSAEGKRYGKHALRFAQNLAKNITSLRRILTFREETSILKDAEPFFAREFNCRVNVMSALDSMSARASKADPGKPGIEVVG